MEQFFKSPFSSPLASYLLLLSCILQPSLLSNLTSAYLIDQSACFARKSKSWIGVFQSPDPTRRAQPSPSKHGFKSSYSTVTALLPLTTNVVRGFNERKPTVRTGLLCVELSKAFDVVDHHRLLKKIGYSDLHSNLKRWLVAYLRDRRVRVIHQGKNSKWRKVKMGVPLAPPLQLFRQ